MHHEMRHALIHREENLYKMLWILAGPLMINNFIQTLYNMADAVWVGRLGEVEFAATSFVWPVIWLFQSLGIGIGVAGTGIVSRLLGEGRTREANRYAGNVLALSVLFSVLLTACGMLATPVIIRWMGAKGEMSAFATQYLSISFLGSGLVFLYFAISGFMNAEGNTVGPMLCSGTAALINIVLDPFFIFERVPWVGFRGLGLGVAGAAYATVLSQGAMLLFSIAILYRGRGSIRMRPSDFRPDGVRMREVVRIAAPAAIGQSGAAIGFTVLNGFINSYGESVMAAFSMVNRITSIVMQPAMGIGTALTGIVGQNLGAGNEPRVVRSFRAACRMSNAITIVGSLLIFAFLTPVLRFFLSSASPGSEVLVLAANYAYYALLTNPLMGLFSIFQGLFQGSGHTRYSMMMAVLRLWGIRIPMILFFKAMTDLGATGIWIAMAVSNVLIDLYGYWVYRRGLWKRDVLHAREGQ